MNRLDALKELANQVESGKAFGHDAAKRKARQVEYEVLGGYHQDSMAYGAFHGSLDAAKALHEAVLPDMLWQFTPLGSCYVRDKRLVELGGSGYGYPDNPARAWLLAILRALISQAETDGVDRLESNP